MKNEKIEENFLEWKMKTNGIIRTKLRHGN